MSCVTAQLHRTESKKQRFRVSPFYKANNPNRPERAHDKKAIVRNSQGVAPELTPVFVECEEK